MQAYCIGFAVGRVWGAAGRGLGEGGRRRGRRGYGELGVGRRPLTAPAAVIALRGRVP